MMKPAFILLLCFVAASCAPVPVHSQRDELIGRLEKEIREERLPLAIAESDYLDEIKWNNEHEALCLSMLNEIQLHEYDLWKSKDSPEARRILAKDRFFGSLNKEQKDCFDAAHKVRKDLIKKSDVLRERRNAQEERILLRNRLLGMY